MTNVSKDYIISLLKSKLNLFDPKVEKKETGKIIEVGDGVAKIEGLAHVAAQEMVLIKTKTGDEIFGVALNLETDSIGVMILGDINMISEGDTVIRTERILEIPVGNEFIGRVVDPLGFPLDNKGEIKSRKTYPIEKIAPGVITRESVHAPVQTGIKAIDSMIPIGRGQRELIIGDRQTGKTAIAIDTIINQKGKNLICIYVAIGQKNSKVARMIAEFEKHGAMDYTIVVNASASTPASLQYIAPYAGCALGEFFMDHGKDVLVVYDDLSKHATAYRQISLILRRPPGREAFPGDIFYAHSRLLERACCLNEDYKGGSLTALPIIETQAGDISAYIPTNVISITDGQIYLESDLFYQGIRPAVNIGLSVSRVGSKAQLAPMKKVAGKIRLDMAQFRELAAFAQFGGDLDEGTKQKLERGRRANEVMKQSQYSPKSVAHQVLIIYAVTNGYLDDIKVENVKKFEDDLAKFVDTNNKKLIKNLDEGRWDDATENAMKDVIAHFKKIK